MTFLFILYIGLNDNGPSVHLIKDILIESSLRGNINHVIVRNRSNNNYIPPLELTGKKNIIFHVINDKILEKGKLVKRYIEDILYAKKCLNIYKNIKDIDAVFLQSCTSPIYPIKYLKKYIGKPVLFNVQNIFPIDAYYLGQFDGFGGKKIVYKFFRKQQQIAYNLSDLVVTISNDMKNTLIEEKCNPSKIKVIYNWTYSDDFYSISDENNLFLNAHPEVRNYYRVVFSGNLGKMVDYKMILNAAIDLEKYEDIRFIIIGGGNNYHNLELEVEKKCLKNVLFYDYQPVEFAPSNYCMADVNINPLPKGIIYTCLPSKTPIILNVAKPMIFAIEKDCELALSLKEIDKCSIIDIRDYKEFSKAILTYYNSKNDELSCNSRLFFLNHCSRKNAQLYVDYMEELKND